MNIQILFPDETNVSNPLIEQIINILQHKKLSGYQIYNEIKKINSDTKYTYKEINSLCANLISTKSGKKICKEGRNPCVYYINDNNTASSCLKKRKNSTISNNAVIDEKYITPKSNIITMFDNTTKNDDIR